MTEPSTGAGTSVVRFLGIALVIGTAVLVLVLSWGRISAVFGDSDEGINGAVWATNSEALREAGPIDSRVGGIRLDGTKYATHPPAIVVQTAAAETLGGTHEWATRAAAWIGSLVALALLYALLRTAKLDPIVAGGGTAAAALTGMFLTYGSMLDTPVTAFPFGVAVMLVWYRQWRAEADTWAMHPAVLALVALLAATAGWQAAMLVALCAVATAARQFRGRTGAWREALPLAIGGALGLALSLGWTWWVYGDFSVLVGKYSTRSGASSSSGGIGDMVDFQIPWIIQLLGLGVVGLGGCIAALRDKALRPLAAMSLSIVVLYPLVFNQAAGGHQYWNYWVLLPTAVGFGFVFRKVAKDAKGAAPAVIIGICAVLGLVNFVVLPDDARTYIDEGHEVVDAFVAASYPEGQTAAWYVGQPYRPDAWIGYYSDLTPTEIATPEQLLDLAVSHPDDLVIVLGDCANATPPSEVCATLQSLVHPAPAPSIVTAAQLAGE